jgi:hypothetical protein
MAAAAAGRQRQKRSPGQLEVADQARRRRREQLLTAALPRGTLLYEELRCVLVEEGDVCVGGGG